MFEIIFLTHPSITHHQPTKGMYTSKSSPFSLLSSIPCLLGGLKSYFSLGIPVSILYYLTQLFILNNDYDILQSIPSIYAAKDFKLSLLCVCLNEMPLLL